MRGVVFVFAGVLAVLASVVVPMVAVPELGTCERCFEDGCFAFPFAVEEESGWGFEIGIVAAVFPALESGVAIEAKAEKV